VAVITEAAIRELATIKGERAPITSCYLDIDGRRLVRHQDLEQEVGAVLRGARARAGSHASVQHDLDRIERLVQDGVDRSRVRGLAIFACSADDLWKVVELPVRVESRVVINPMPAVGQLEALLQDNEAIGVLLADKHRARLFVFELGELVEHSELFEEPGRDEGPRGERDRGDNAQSVEERVHQHLRHAADVAFRVWRRHRFEHLAIAAPDQLVATLEAALHPYLRDRLRGRLQVPVGAAHGAVLAAAQQIESDVIRRRDAALVDRLRSAVAGGRRGVAGLGAVADALADHRIDWLVVSKGYDSPGWRCDRCGRLATIGRRCKRCGDEMVEIDDLVEEVTQEALAQSCRVDICTGNADLDVMGRIGALLRY
jgi:peptide chain release factor subunit 1